MVNMSMTERLSNAEDFQDDITSSTKPFAHRLKRYCLCGRKTQFLLQCLHFGISIFFLFAGIMEFIDHPPYFDAYGDAKRKYSILPIVENDPSKTEWELLRLMDLPILALLLVYKTACIWLRYKGLSWLLTIGLCFPMLCFWLVNFCNIEQFDWKYYSTRMDGLQLQVSSIALSGTIIFMVIFYTRKKLPFKFKSSISMKINYKVQLVWNILAIYLILFACFMIWFVKMYASWAFFRSRSEITRLCSTTQQVECYPCKYLNVTSLKECLHRTKHKRFACAQNFPERLCEGSICIFNFNLGVYSFLLTFAYIGGLSVFLSTFLRIMGHYAMRGLIFVYETILKWHYRSSDFIGKKRRSVRRLRSRRRDGTQRGSGDDNENILASEPTEVYESESDDEGNGLINSLIYEMP